MRTPLWVSDEVVLAIHKRQIAEHGGAEGIRDTALLESALQKPKQRFAYDPDTSFAALAASYAFGIARNHPFIDGNKRTAYVVCRVFLKLNGVDIEADKVAKYQAIYGLASGALDQDGYAKWLADHTVA